MPNIKSVTKDLKRSRRRAVRNADMGSRVKTAIKKARQAIAGGDAEEAQTAARSAARLLDKAAAKGVVHKRAAARRKSRLARGLRAARPPAPAPAEPESAPAQPDSGGLGPNEGEQRE